MNDAELLYVLRGDEIESVHRGSYAIVDQTGITLEAAGASDALVWMRSVAKPFQAGVVVASGAARQFNITDDELAIMCGSHGGTPEQIERLRGVMERIGVTETDLHCGKSAPLDRKAAEALNSRGETPTAVHHPCSGKHIGMLAVCQARGWQIEGYERADHPLQMAILSYFSNYASTTNIMVALDGCSVPTFGVSLYAVALAFARLGGLPRVAAAMRARPVLMSGHRRMDTMLMQITNGRIAAKDGSEGLFALSLPDMGIGVALKIADGSTRAIMPVLTALLSRHGYLTPEETARLQAAYPTAITIHTGEVAGELRVII